MKRHLFCFVVILLFLFSLSGCRLMRAVFGYSEEEVIQVISLVLDAIDDTVDGAGYFVDTVLNQFTYLSKDAGFSLQLDSRGTLVERFSFYNPPDSELQLHGIIGTGGGYWDRENAPLEGYIFLVDEWEGNMYIDVKLYGELINGRMTTEGAEFYGTVDGRGVDDAWGLKEIAVKNQNLLTGMIEETQFLP